MNGHTKHILWSIRQTVIKDLGTIILFHDIFCTLKYKKKPNDNLLRVEFLIVH